MYARLGSDPSRTALFCLQLVSLSPFRFNHHLLLMSDELTVDTSIQAALR